MNLIKKGATYFPQQDEDKNTYFIRTGGKKLTFDDGTVVVYMPPRQAKQYGKFVKRDASFSVTYPWGKKEGPMSLIKFKNSFGEKFVNKVLGSI